jgi:hypothetical protein
MSGSSAWSCSLSSAPIRAREETRLERVLHEQLLTRACVLAVRSKYGSVGTQDKAFSMGVDGQVKKAAKTSAPEWITLPGCLETFLKQCLLKKAKTDTLAKMKTVIRADPACQKLLAEHRSYFKEEFKERALDGLEAGSEPTWTLEVMMKDFIDRGLMKDVVVHPRAQVAGTTPPPVHSNLSRLDAKGAFGT